LTYKVFERGYTVGKVDKDKRKNGDLIAIEYSIPEKIEKGMFVERK
jgi:hypothetical protein